LTGPLIKASRIVRLSPPYPVLDSQLCKFQKEDYVKNIFVGNLSFGATEDALRSMFEAYGAVDRVNVVTDRDTGRARGFGFVEMSENAEADRAIAGLNGKELDGRALNVNEARPKEDRGGGGFRGNGGGQRQSKRW
jgi:RNA recognition motif-containing protein